MPHSFQTLVIILPPAIYNFTTDSISFFSQMKVIANNLATLCAIYKKPIPVSVQPLEKSLDLRLHA